MPLFSLLGIMESGLQVMPKDIGRGMFGNGIYLADSSSKSAKYCGNEHLRREAVLLLCEADVGTDRVSSTRAIYHGHELVAKSGGSHRCIQGLGSRAPREWKAVTWPLVGEPRQGTVLMVSLPG